MQGIAALLGYRLARWAARLGAGMLVAAMARRMDQRMEQRRERAAAAGAAGRGRLPDPVAAAVPGATLAVLKALIDRSATRRPVRRRT